MSIGSFSSSLSGLKANQTKLAVIGNNLANMNTVGYKAGQVTFADLVSQSVGGSSANPMQVGLGVTTSAIAANFSQGGIDATGVATNVAVQGNGFFVIGGADARGYTRAGDFSFDQNGRLVTSDGRPVQGFTTIDPVTGNVNTTGQPTDIVITPGVLRAPSPTRQMNIVSNLNSASPVGTTFATAVPVYDSLGVAHIATVTWTKTGVGAWSYAMAVPGADVTGGAVGAQVNIAIGTMTFNGAGQLLTVNGGVPADVTVTGPAWSNGATPVNFTWDLVNAQGAASITSFGAPSGTASISQNGASASSINSLTIGSSGELLASFGAGQVVAVAQLAIATFNNPQGLVKGGGNLLTESGSSGSANIGTAGTGGRGTLIGGALEQSNVDMAQEFTQMILAQRGFQANSKSINVADELLQEALNLRR
jgi:flagellar hook protein FlgE